MGERPEGAGAAGALILPVAGKGVRRGRPLFDPGQGNREGDAGERWAGPGVGPVGPAVQWGGGPSPFFSFSLSVLFSVFFLFVYFLFCFISFKSI